jgi:hypothetical protein
MGMMNPRKSLHGTWRFHHNMYFDKDNPTKKESAHSGDLRYMKDKNEKKTQGISDKKTDPA